ncbi:MAG: peptide-methionine (S)-S-oxide reductase MsrA [Gammaproteobacteria bacterium]|nr:peptide-methionine (S)-S-oxide reductase MsrA [Gammaproteobacteria bacterium]
MFGLLKKTAMPEAADALPGRPEAMIISDTHLITGKPMRGPWPAPLEVAIFGMGCFWGVERLFWQQPGVHSTAVGYAGGYTVNPTYEEVCSGMTGHNEVVQVVYDPAVISYSTLLRLFWESHDPTQGMRQGNDTGTQYRSGIYATTPEQLDAARTSQSLYQQALSAAPGAAMSSTITTEILEAPEFYYAEDFHQQYLHKNPGGYCNLRGTGVDCVG